MPELPEVEVLRMSLSERLIGKKIIKVKVYNKNLRYKIEKNFEKKLKNKFIKEINRRSKYIIFLLNKKTCLIIHLGMSGVIFLEKIKSKKKIKTSFYYELNKLKKHNHININFDRGYKLIYNDPRRFGFFKIIKENNIQSFFKNLGPEPLDKKFNILYFKKYINNKKKNIKNLLLDQNFISGIGNIYANEVLFYSKIKPGRSAQSLSNIEIEKIILYIKQVLRKSIKLGGSSIKDFSNISGKPGLFQENFAVYDRLGCSCIRKNCKGSIQKIFISNRSSFYCNKCQN